MKHSKKRSSGISKLRNLYRAVIAAQGLWILAAPTEAYALKDTQLYTGTIKLINDGLIVLLAVEAVLVVFLSVKELIALQGASDEDKPKHKKNIKTILIVGVLAISASGILTAIFSYYQAADSAASSASDILMTVFNYYQTAV